MNSLRTSRAAAALTVALSLVALAGCQSAPPAPPAPSTSAAPGASPDDAVNRVLAISIDGLNPRAITQLGAKEAPAFYQLIREGAYTFNARSEYEMTKTLPNHTGMLTSRRIDAKKGGHGIDFNSDTGTTVHKQAGRYVASVFDVIHDRGGSTAMFSAKTKFELYERTWNTNGRNDPVGADNGRQKIDKVNLDTDNARLVRSLNADLLSSPRTFTFLHISLPDLAGHEYGFMSEQYVAAVKQTDELLRTVLDTVASKPALKDHTVVLLTADHGGNGATHTNPTTFQNYRVPFMAWGPGVPSGRNLYAINPAFKDPKTSRPSYAGKQPIRNGDIANVSTDILDLPVVPGSTLDRPRALNLFK